MNTEYLEAITNGPDALFAYQQKQYGKIKEALRDDLRKGRMPKDPIERSCKLALIFKFSQTPPSLCDFLAMALLELLEKEEQTLAMSE